MHRRVLVVEDDPNIAGLLRVLLRSDGHRVECALTGREALAKVEAGRFSLILLDLYLPDIDGFVLTRRFRELRPRCPILVVSARVLSAPQREALDLAAVALVVRKPFAPAVLLEAVRDSMSSQGLPRRARSPPGRVSG